MTAPAQAMGPVHAPLFPEPKFEEWWIFLVHGPDEIREGWGTEKTLNPRWKVLQIPGSLPLSRVLRKKRPGGFQCRN